MADDNSYWTTCTTADKVIGINQYISAAISSGLLGAAMVVVLAAGGAPWCIPIAASITFMVWVLAYCDWWLNNRLVCLADDGQPISVVGMVVSIEPPSEKTWPGSLDSDYSINLLLPDNPVGVSAPDAYISSPFGHLMEENAKTAAEGLLFTGNQAEEKATGKKSECLHAEFEGAAIHDLQLVNAIALAASVVALVICMTGVGAIIAAILAILAFLAALFGAAFSGEDTADPSDAGIASIEVNQANGVGATIVGVTGRWVYDAGHIHDSFNEAHNELHPIVHAQVLGTWDGDWPVDIDAIVSDYTAGYGESRDPLTVSNQDAPANRWTIHPLIDGCDPGDGAAEVPR